MKIVMQRPTNSKWSRAHLRWPHFCLLTAHPRFQLSDRLMNWKTIKNTGDWWSCMILQWWNHFTVHEMHTNASVVASLRVPKGQLSQLRKFEKKSLNTAGRCCNRTKRWCLPLTKPFTIVFISLSFAVHWRILQTIMSRLERRKFNVPFSAVFARPLLLSGGSPQNVRIVLFQDTFLRPSAFTIT